MNFMGDERKQSNLILSYFRNHTRGLVFAYHQIFRISFVTVNNEPISFCLKLCFAFLRFGRSNDKDTSWVSISK